MLSVVLACFNGKKYIKEQIDSILSQLEIDDELIISDDHSYDGTFEYISELYKDELRVKIFRNTSGRGVVSNFENGLMQASGNIIALADQDDIWLSGRIILIKSKLEIFDLLLMNSYVTSNDIFDRNLLLSDIISMNPSFTKNLIKNTFVGCHMAFKSSFLKRILPFPYFIPMHDSFIALTIIFNKGKVLIDKTPTMIFRRHEANSSSTCYKSNRFFVEKFLDRYLLLQGILYKSIFHHWF